MESVPQELRFELCLDSNCSFGKIDNTERFERE